MSRKKNITLRLDESLLKASRHIAVEEDKSLSEWVSELVAKAVMHRSALSAARKRGLKLLEKPLHLGGKTFKRDELHER